MLYDEETSLGLKYAYIRYINVPHMPPDNLKGDTWLKLLNFVTWGPSLSESGSHNSKPKVQGSNLQNHS